MNTFQYFREPGSYTFFYKTNLSSVCSKKFSYRLNLFSDSIKVSKEELFSEIAGFTSEFFGENAAEVGEVVKSDIETNLCYIEWGVEQQVFSFVEAECAQVFEQEREPPFEAVQRHGERLAGQDAQ